MADEFNKKLALLIKSEKAMLNMMLRKKARQVIFSVVALIAILIAVVMLNIAIFYYLTMSLSTALSAIILMGMNLLVALLFFIIAAKQSLGSEAEAINEIRSFAWEQVADDMDEVKKEVYQFKSSVDQVGNSLSSLFDGGLFSPKSILEALHFFIKPSK